MNKVKYVIFDCDGVLVDSEILANRVEAEVKTSLGFPTTVEEQITRFVGMGMNSKPIQDELSRLPEGYLEMVDRKIHEVYDRKLQAIAKVSSTLTRLTLPKCVASSSDPFWIDRKLTLTGLRSYFGDAIFSGHSVQHGKPAPDLFFQAAATMGWESKDCLVIEDSEAGVLAGRAAGMVVCGFTGGSHIFPGHAERLIHAGAHYIISDMTNLLRLTN